MSNALKNDSLGGSSEKPFAAQIIASPSKNETNSGKDNKQAKNNLRQKKAFMYLGPNIPGGILFSGSVYKELPEHLAGVFEKLPELKKLFVEIKDVPAFKSELERQGSEPFRVRQNVEHLINKGALKNGGV